MMNTTICNAASALLRLLRPICLTVALVGSNLQGASVKTLIEQADAIVIGRLTGCFRDGTNPARATLGVERTVFKGSLLSGTSILTAVDLGELPGCGNWRNWSRSGRSVWFLKQLSGDWVLIRSRGFGQQGWAAWSYPVPDHQDFLGSSPAVGDLVVGIVSALADASEPPLLIQDPLMHDDSPAIRAVLRKFMQAPDAHLALFGLWELLKRGDEIALSALSKYASVIKANPDGYGSWVLVTIRSFFRNSSAPAIETLGRLVGDTSLGDDIRYALAFALRSIHTKECVRPLARLLDDDSMKLKAEGVIGLAFFANGIGISTVADSPSMNYLNHPAPSRYKTEETRQYLGFDESRAAEFVGFWKNWWIVNQGDF